MNENLEKIINDDKLRLEFVNDVLLITVNLMNTILYSPYSEQLLENLDVNDVNTYNIAQKQVLAEKYSITVPQIDILYETLLRLN